MSKEKVNKNLKLWSFPYRKRYYLTHPWKWFYDAYWNVRNFWHRGKYGYAYVDVWNWYDWWPRVGAEALRYLAEHNSGYPAVEPWETPEKWHDHLIQLANDLEWCAKTESELENITFDNIDDIQKREKIFAEIGKNLGRYWD